MVPHERSAAPELDGVGAAMVFGGAMNVDQEDANPWLRGEKDAAAPDCSARACRSSGCASARSCWPRRRVPRRGAPRSRRSAGRRWSSPPAGRADPLIGALPERFEAFEWHSYEAPLPDGAVALARSPVCLQAYRLDGARAWGIQFHAEVTGADVNAWLDAWDSDEDAVRIGLDPEALRAETLARLAGLERARAGDRRALPRRGRGRAGHSGVT